MKCFNHHDRDAFGICISCKKALCNECLELVENQVSCKGGDFCHKRAFMINKAHTYNEKYIPRAENTLNTAHLRHVLILIIGLILIVFGLFLFLFFCGGTIFKIISVIALTAGILVTLIAVKLLKSKAF